MPEDDTDLPHEMTNLITAPFARFLKIETMAGAALLLATLGALILSNSAWSTQFLAFWKTPIDLHFGAWAHTRPLWEWINDGLMTLSSLSSRSSSSTRLGNCGICVWQRCRLPVRSEACSYQLPSTWR